MTRFTLKLVSYINPRDIGSLFAVFSILFLVLAIFSPLFPYSTIPFLGKFCHRIPERSFHIYGYYLGICARCFGFHVGIISSLFFFRKNTISMISLITINILSFLGFISIALYILHYDVSNIFRFIFGIGLGTLAMTLLFRWFHLPLLLLNSYIRFITCHRLTRRSS
jgi:uncharacterized membrane protein